MSIMTKMATLRVNEKLYSDVKDEVLSKYDITFTEFVIRCMIISLEDEIFKKDIDTKYWKYIEILQKKYKN